MMTASEITATAERDQIRRDRRRNTEFLPGSVVSRFHKPRLQQQASILFLFVLACLSSLALAATIPTSPPPISPTETETATTTTRAASGPRITIPLAEPPIDSLILDPSLSMHEGDDVPERSNTEINEELRRRNPAPIEGSTTTVSIVPSTVTQQSTPTKAPSGPLPSPLDTSLSADFTNPTCPAFINWMLSDPTFKQCYPLSLLLQTSKSFFDAAKSLVSTTQVLDASCAANVTFCSGYLSGLARNLTAQEGCGADFQLGNKVVNQTYVALVSYQTLYSASCLKDMDTGSYCFATAITNLTTPSNAYFYFLPLNMSLPDDSNEFACGKCLQQTMAIYQASSAYRSQPIAFTYPSAAQQVNIVCGPGFVNESLPTAIYLNSASPPLPSFSWLLMGSTALTALVVTLLL